jgi:polyhydroxyalkanoic acid synthase PhaR subunit
MTEERQPVDPFQVWREWLTESERHWNTFFQDVLGNDQIASGMNRLVEAQIGVQRLMAEGTERFLKMWSVPTTSDVNRVDDRLSSIEERLAGIERILSDASQEPAAQHEERPAVEVRRTRQPPAENNSSFGI